MHQLIAELYDGVDWVLVEGFKDSDLLKIEVWRAASGKPARYPHDDFIVAIATDAPDALPEPTLRPVLDLNDPDAIAALAASTIADRFEYARRDTHERQPRAAAAPLDDALAALLA